MTIYKNKNKNKKRKNPKVYGKMVALVKYELPVGRREIFPTMLPLPPKQRAHNQQAHGICCCFLVRKE